MYGGVGGVSGQLLPLSRSLETYSYNNRLQVSQIELGTSGNASADYNLTYNYYLPGGTTPPGCPVAAGGGAVTTAT